MSLSSPRNIVVMIVLAATLYLLGNGRVSLWDRDEPRYAQTSRQMLQSGDWVVPRFLDTVRTAKPVFIYWCQAAAMGAVGSEGEGGVFAARLPSAIAMTIVLAILAVVIRRYVSPAHAFWTVFILATCGLTLWSAKACTTDSVLLIGITVAQLCLYAIWRGHTTWPVIIVMAIAIAQAGLTKGPVVLGVMGMTLLALGVFRLIDRRRPPLPLPSGEGRGEGMSNGGSRILQYDTPSPLPSPGGRGGLVLAVVKAVTAIIIVAALVAPWIYLVQHRESKFLGTSVSHDVLHRIAQPLEGHKGPPGYHLALVFGTFFPWSILLPMAIVFGWKHRTDPRVRFALAATIGPWLMFELVRTKLPHYMLPAFPAMALLTADAIGRCLRGEHDDLRRRGFAFVSAIPGIAMIAMAGGAVYLAKRFHDPLWPPIALICVAVIFALVVVDLFRRQQIQRGLLAMGVGMACVYVALFGVYLPHADSLRISTRTADILLRDGATAPGSVVMMDYKEPSLAFYQGGTIREETMMSLSHDLLDRAPRWLVITDGVWAKAAPDVRERLDVLGTVHGLAYADGREVTTMVVRQRGKLANVPSTEPSDILSH